MPVCMCVRESWSTCSGHVPFLISSLRCYFPCRRVRVEFLVTAAVYIRLGKVMFFIVFVAGAVCGRNCMGHGGASVRLGEVVWLYVQTCLEALCKEVL